MKWRILTLVEAIICSFLALTEPAFPQDTLVTYQGRLTDNGTNFNGAGQFKFAVVTSTNTSVQATAAAEPPSGGFITVINVLSGGSGYLAPPAVTISGGGGSGATATASISGGAVTAITVNNPGSGYTSTPSVTVAPPPPTINYTTYWSNDGTSVNGSEPAAAVGVGVNNGLFTVVLGDTTQTNMQAIPVSLFTEPNLQLRIWFNDGVNGFVALSPVQNLTATPYAAYASVANASNLVGTLPPAQLPAVVLTNNAANVSLSGSFSGNGAGVTNISVSSINPEGAFSLVSPYFAAGVSLNVGSSPYSVVAVDVNGDGKLDLVSANLGGNSLTVLTNDGAGGFALYVTIPVGSGPISVVAADVNGDGKPDLICANDSGNTLTVVTNNGTGFGFSATLPLPAGSNPYYVAVADLNGDGKPDLIASDTINGSTLTIFTNNGTGLFGLNAIVTVGGWPNEVAVADVNGDGKPDLISANWYDGTLTVLTNNGSGGFGSNATLQVGSGPVSVVAINIRGAGLPDLICANTDANTLTVLTNNGRGAFGFNATLHIGTKPQSVIAVDLNGDGKPDLISANTYDNSLTVLTNNGSGGFGFNATLSVGAGTWQVIAADLNGDGTPDLISANASGSTLTEILAYGRALDFAAPTLGSGLLNLNASQLTSGTVPLARLPAAVVTNNESGVTLSGTFSGNVAQLAANQTFTGVNTFNAPFQLSMGSQGSMTFEGQIVPLIDVTGGSAPGHLRLRNALEIWPNDGATAGGYLDVRALNGANTIILNGTNGNVSAVSFTQTSDRNAKENFRPVDTREVLEQVSALPITRWNYKVEGSSVEHIGPVAQDFHGAFRLGADDKHIAPLDTGGVALAAIQGLNQRLSEELARRDMENAELRRKNQTLEQRLEVLEKMIVQRKQN